MKNQISAIFLANVRSVRRLAFVFALIGLLTIPATAQVFEPGPSDSALFDTVIDLPPAPNIGSNQEIGGDVETTVILGTGEETTVILSTTQLNLSDGGSINSSFDVLAGAELNVDGGGINFGIDVRSGGELNISGGLIGFSAQAFSGSHVTMTGGLVEQSFEAQAGSVVVLKGGALSRRFRARAGSEVEIFGGEFELNGNAIPLVDPSIVSLAGTDVLTGILEDGSSFIFSPEAGDEILGVRLITTRGGFLPSPPIVIDTPFPVRPSGVRAGQTLTLLDGGELDINFEAVDATVNIEGGFIGDHSGFSRSVVNISGGEVDAFSNAYAGTIVNLTGGTWGRFSDAHSGSVVNVIDGLLESFFEAKAGSTINIQGGVVENRFQALSGSTVNIEGGVLGTNFDINAGVDAELFGGEFRLNGEAFTGSTLTVGDDDVFTGTLADGTAFIFDGQSSDDVEDLNLVEVALPALDLTPQVIDTADHGRPSGLREGQTLTVLAGGVLGNFFETVDGSTLNIDGGVLGEDAAVVNGTVNIISGEVRRAFSAGIGSVVNYSGGTMGNQSEAQSGSTFNFSGGQIGSEFFVEFGSVVNVSGGDFEEDFTMDGEVDITGGNFEELEANSGSVVNISGGRFEGEVSFRSGCEVNLLGSDFQIDGVSAIPRFQGENFTAQARNAVLSGTFTDGTPFSFDFSGNDSLNSTAVLTLTGPDTPELILGDCNLDGIVDFFDIQPFIDFILSDDYLAEADTNQDDAVNFFDIQPFIDILLAP